MFIIAIVHVASIHSYFYHVLISLPDSPPKIHSGTKNLVPILES